MTAPITTTTVLRRPCLRRVPSPEWPRLAMYNTGNIIPRYLHNPYSREAQRWHAVWTKHRAFAIEPMVARRSKVTTSNSRSPTLPKIHPASTKKSVLSNPSTPHKAYQILLGSKSTPTLLYTAPSHTSYFVSSYSAALFSYTYAYYNLQTIFLHPPEGLANWVSTSFGGICALFAALGTYILLGPTRLIKSISAVPTKSGKPGEFVEIRVELRKMVMLPESVWPRRVIDVKPEECTLEHVLYTPPPPGYDLQLQQAMQPSNRVSKALFRAFNGMKRTFTRNGFIELQVKEKPYKLDITEGAWGLQDGQALDRLVKTKQQ